MSSARRVRRYREQHEAAGRKRYEYFATPQEAELVREFIGLVTASDAERVRMRILLDSARNAPEPVWPNDTWADYIAFAQRGMTGEEPDDPVFERSREPDRAYFLDFD